jgi:hypothetical protein
MEQLVNLKQNISKPSPNKDLALKVWILEMWTEFNFVTICSDVYVIVTTRLL